jgi:hypothetical protein
MFHNEARVAPLEPKPCNRTSRSASKFSNAPSARLGGRVMANVNNGRFVWCEHITKDPKAAIAVYSDVIG